MNTPRFTLSLWILLVGVISQGLSQTQPEMIRPLGAAVDLPLDYPTLDPTPSRAYSDPMCFSLNGRDWRMTLTEPSHRYTTWDRVVRGQWPRVFSGVTVPGSVQSAMLETGARARGAEYAMPRPDYYSTYSEHLTRATVFESWFHKKFAIPNEWQGKRVHLRFNAVDYDSHFFFNGQEVGSNIGHFAPVTLEVTQAARYGKENDLVVQIAPFVNDRSLHVRSQILKNQQGDNNPAASPLGISGDVHVFASDTVFIENLCIRPELNDDFSKAVVETIVTGDSLADIDAEIECTVRSLQEPKQTFSSKTKARFAKGESKAVAKVAVEEPQLWWPNGAGDQNLYEAEVVIRSSDGRVLDSHKDRFGIRELKMVFNEGVKDKNFPYPWTFMINGRKIYAKGGNWAPADPYYRVDRAMYERFILHAKNAHFNILRWWGGGMPERDSFYDLCDEHGIMVFQDFFLANSTYEDPEFLKLIIPQGRGFVRRLRNHPCIVLWTGGNELRPCKATEILGQVAAEEDPTRAYRPPSPTAGEKHGPFYTYRPEQSRRLPSLYNWSNNNTVQVRSEFGSGAASNPDAIRRVIPALELPLLLQNQPLTLSWLHHCAHCWMDHATTLGFYGDIFQDKDLETYCAASQYPRAEGRRYEIEEMRRKKFRASITMFWQFNESYANTSSNCDVDWWAQPRLHHYFTAKAHQPILACLRYKNILWKPGDTFKAELWAVSDVLQDRPGCEIEWRILDVGGKRVAGSSQKLDIRANSSIKVGDVSWDIPKEYDSYFVVYCTIRDATTGELLSRNEYIPLAHGSTQHKWTSLLHGPKTSLAMQVERTGKKTAKVTVTNTGGVNALLCTLKLPKPAGAIALFDSNAFCLAPGEKHEVALESLNPSKPDWEPDFSKLMVKAWNSKSVSGE